MIALVLGLLLRLDANAQSRKAVLTRHLLRAPRSLHSFDDYRMLESMRQTSMFVPSVATLFGTLISVLTKFANLVMSTDCALAANSTSLLCICTRVAKK